jgi:hypothetical protein
LYFEAQSKNILKFSKALYLKNRYFVAENRAMAKNLVIVESLQRRKRSRNFW